MELWKENVFHAALGSDALLKALVDILKIDLKSLMLHILFYFTQFV